MTTPSLPDRYLTAWSFRAYGVNMTNTATIAAIEYLRTFAASQIADCDECYDKFTAFVKLCTAALQGEEWAVERVQEVIAKLASMCAWPGTGINTDAERLWVIRDTDCTRPDGAIARSFQP